ncbi:hypothetical protein HRbin26_00180 [bacterium HR26]|nr:hypothetical protein HRbin26_00180 [bacterium HR26]
MLPARFRRLQVLAGLWLALSALSFLSPDTRAAEPPPELGLGAPGGDACERLGGRVPLPREGGPVMEEGTALSFPAFTFDTPVLDGKETSWLFGARYGITFVVPYHDANLLGDWSCFHPRTTQGMRWVMYFDKGRIELSHVPPEAFWLPIGEKEVEVGGQQIPLSLYRAGWDPDSPLSLWALTAGQLARELLTGQLQVGDNAFIQREPAAIPVAGDPDGGGVTYAVLGRVMGYQPLPAGWPVLQTIDSEGEVSADSNLGAYGVTYLDIGAPTRHTLASVFWDFFQQSGWQAREIIGARFPGFPVPQPITFFQYTLHQVPHRFPWLLLVGWPITEPYWTRAKAAGMEQWVLVQCFERRCLTYTPSNPPGWQVEMGNIGRHYYQWRYGQERPAENWQLPPWWEYQP